jgi:hypothetical protein
MWAHDATAFRGPHSWVLTDARTVPADTLQRLGELLHPLPLPRLL